MKRNISQPIPAAIPVEELAAQMEITPNNLRLAIELVAAAGYTVDLGLGIHVKVEILDDPDDDSDDCACGIIELARLSLAAGSTTSRTIPLQIVRNRIAGFPDVSRFPRFK